jgi:hypothetical protein
MWQAVSVATGGLAGYRGYDSPAQGTPASWPGPGAGPAPANASLQVISIKPNIGAVQLHHRPDSRAARALLPDFKGRFAGLPVRPDRRVLFGQPG